MPILLAIGDVMFWILALIVFILVLGVIICLHEGGHFFFARKAGILCHEYSLGMGPLIKQWKKPGHETAISIRAIPIGGYVSMAGEDTNETLLKEEQKIGLNLDENNFVKEIIVDPKQEGQINGLVSSYDLYSQHGEQMYIELKIDEEYQTFNVNRDALYVFGKKERVQIAPYDRCFESKKWWPRFITIFGGPLMNFILALVIFIMVGLIQGVPQLESNEVGDISELYPASRVLQSGDQIVSVEGKEVASWTAFQEEMTKYIGNEKISITYQRDGKNNTVQIDTIIRSYRLGVANFDIGDTEGDGNYIYHSDEGLKVSLLYNKDYVASKAGIQNGDIILGYYDLDRNFVETKTWKSLVSYIDSNGSLKYIELKVKHGDETKDVGSEVWEESSLDLLGVARSTDTVIGVSSSMKFSFFGGLGNAFVLFGNSIATVFKTLWGLIANSQIHITDLSGPVGIFSVIKSYLSTDFITFMSFVGLISANIGVVNLLPIPALDGGRIMFLAYEGITRRKIKKKTENLLTNITYFLLMGLFVFITIKDVIQLIAG